MIHLIGRASSQGGVRTQKNYSAGDSAKARRAIPGRSRRRANRRIRISQIGNSLSPCPNFWGHLSLQENVLKKIGWQQLFAIAAKILLR